MIERAALLLLCALKIPGLNLGLENSSHDRCFVDFLFLQSKARIVLQSRL
jgi:hypothetical protein